MLRREEIILKKRKISLYFKCIWNRGGRAGRVKRKNAKKGGDDA